MLEAWRIDYNTNRPHSALKGMTPSEFATQITTIRNVQEDLSPVAINALKGHKPNIGLQL